MRKFSSASVFSLCLLCLCVSPAIALEWSEILPDPSGNDNGREFIELAGLESLEGCIIRDSASEDVLELLHVGTSSAILIVESDGIFASWETEATVYGAGKAIGNGLGNTIDALQIVCDDAELLTTTYDVSVIKRYEPGMSLLYEKNSWITGSSDGLPGKVGNSDPRPNPLSQSLPEPSPELAENNISCNDTLLIAVGALSVFSGETLTFSIFSESLATYDVFADNNLFSFGDTAQGNKQSIEVPSAKELRIVATSEQCESRQRATRILSIVQQELERSNLSEKNVSKKIVVEESESLASPPRETPSPVSEAKIPLETPVPQSFFIEQKKIIVDEETSVIPWVSAFGIATLAISTVLFFHVSRREDREGFASSRRKIYKRRKGPSVYEGQRDLQTDKSRLDQGDRHL